MIFNSCYFGGSGVCVSACLSVYVSVCVFPSFGFANVRLFISCVFNLLGLDLFFFLVPSVGLDLEINIV